MKFSLLIASRVSPANFSCKLSKSLASLKTNALKPTKQSKRAHFAVI